MSDEAIETFKKAARPYGLRYLHLHDSNGDGLSTLMVRGEDAAVINRLIERNKLAVLTDVTQAEIERDPSKAADINEPIPEVVIGKDQVRVQDAVKEARGSAQDLLKPEPNPTKGQTEQKSRLSSKGLKTSEMEQEAEELWADVTASIDKDFAERIEEKRQHNFELYNQDDPLQRLRLLHDIYRPGLEETFRYDAHAEKKLGMNWKDSIAPLSAEALNSCTHLKIGGRYCKTLFLNAYPIYLNDRIVSDIASIGKPMIFTIDFLPIPSAEAMAEAESRSMAIDTKIVNYTLHQQRNGNYSGSVPYKLMQRAAGVQEVMEAIQERDQNLYLVTVTVAHFADTREELENDAESIMSKGKSISCQFLPLLAQQYEGLNTALPFGRPFIQADRLLTTQALAGICPFAAQEIYYPGGSWFGINAKTKRLITINRDMLMSGNSLVLATTGGGKSFHIKEDALQVALKGEADIFFVDPECEYVVATQRLGGTVISLSPSTPHRINPLEISADPDDRSSEPLKEKLEFVMSFCRILLMEDGNVLDGKMKSLLDRCVRKLYAPVVASGYTKPSPLLGDLYRMLKEQDAPEAQELALRMEIYTAGSYDMFAQSTNVDTQAHIIDYDLSKLGEGMNAVGMLIVLESIYSRLMDNWRKKRHTYIYIDEIMTIFRNPYAAQYFASLWQRIRKRGGYIIGATQNTTEILNSPEARKLLENSYIITMLYQSAPDRDVLAEMFSLSEAQKQALAKEQYGTGLIKVGSTIVPFENDFPTDNPLYQLMSTKPSDGWGQEVNEHYDV